jgi:hypothetical protein
MAMYNNNSVQTDFKIILNSNDTNTWTGSKFNANYNLDLKQILFNDRYFDKSYRMTYQFKSTSDPALSGSKIYLASFLLSNGASQQGVFQPLGTPYQTTGFLNVVNDSNQVSTIGTTYTISATTTGTNYITLNTTSGLSPFQQFVFSGTAGGLTAGTYYIYQIINSTQITLLNVNSLSTATGITGAFGTISYSSQSSYLEALETDNAPTFINNLRNITSVNVKISDHTYTPYSNTTVNYVCILHFTEIQGDGPYNKGSYVNNTNSGR